MRVAVVGCGSIGRRHIGNLLDLGCEVFGFDAGPYSVVDRAKEEYPDLNVAGAAAALSGSYVDALVIATPWNTHLEWAQWAVGRQMPFFVEKPLGALDQIEDWRAIVHASEGLTSQIGYQCRFHWAAKALKRLFPMPTEGDVECDVDMRQWPGGAYGPLLLEASHDLDMALWLGMPNIQEAFGGAFWADVWAANWRVQIHDRRNYYRRWKLAQGRHQAEFVFGSREELGDLMYRDEMLHFLECVREKRQTDVPLRDGLRVLEACHQIEQMTTAAA